MLETFFRLLGPEVQGLFGDIFRLLGLGPGDSSSQSREILTVGMASRKSCQLYGPATQGTGYGICPKDTVKLGKHELLRRHKKLSRSPSVAFSKG